MDLTTSRSTESATKWASQVATLMKERSDDAAVHGIEQATEQFQAARFQIAVLGKESAVNPH